MIHGVKIKQLIVHKDVPDTDQTQELGILMEVVRDDDTLLSKFGQSTMSVAPTGTIKAFHHHKYQDDLWFIASGKARIVLYDTRESSPTYKKIQIINAGEGDYKVVLIPVGVAHGYKVLSKEPVILFYHTTKSYDAKNPDEERLPWDILGANVWE